MPAMTPVNGHNGTNGGNDHFDGADGYSNGFNGTNGANGTNGVHRANGTNGTNGAHGANGINGTNGTNGTNGINGANGTNGVSPINGVNGLNHVNGSNGHMNYAAETANGSHSRNEPAAQVFEPIAVCGMACRLPGGISSPNELWDFLIQKKDGRIKVPSSRFNVEGFYSKEDRPGTMKTQYGYFLDESVDLGGLDTSFFSMSKMEVEWLDPQQRMLLEVARESLDDAGDTKWKGSNMGVYIGNFAQDWYDILNRDPLGHSVVSVISSHDFMLSERISHEMDLHGPSMTIRTACSSGLICLNEACMAIAKGDCESAIVGGANMILAPDLLTRLTEQGMLSPDGECKTFSAAANGYSRGEAIVSIVVKKLSAAIRDGNPIRSIISGVASNFDGKTNPLSSPSAVAQEALIRRTYEAAGISDFSKTALFECHGTGTATGDPIETEAIAKVFGEKGIYLGAVKPNLGHSEGASGITAVIKATLSLEHQMIAPNIKYLPLNPRIPFEQAKFQIPGEPTPWPADREQRISINSFGVGGANAHAIVESPAKFLSSYGGAKPNKATKEAHLMLFSANTAQSLTDMIRTYESLLSETDLDLGDIAYTLANRREHLPHKSFAVVANGKVDAAAPTPPASPSPSLIMVFTGQGAAWPRMGRELMLSDNTFASTIRSLDKHLQTLGTAAPPWSLEEELLKPLKTSRVYEAEISQPLCTALQIALVDTLAAYGIRPAAVVGHSSGEIGAAYAAGGLTAEEAITIASHRGSTSKRQTQPGGMAAVGLSWDDAQKFLVPGVVTACDNSPSSVTLSGDADKLKAVVADIMKVHPDIPATMLKVEKAYHSHQMLALGEDYHQAMVDSGVVGKAPAIPFYSSVTGNIFGSGKHDSFGPRYWQANLERPVLFKSAVTGILRTKELKNQIFLEVGPHSALAGPLRQILASESSKASYVASLVRKGNAVENILQATGKLYTLNAHIDFQAITPAGRTVPGLPCYPWDHSHRYWFESRVATEYRARKFPNHSLLGAKLPESTDFEPVWRNLLLIRNTPWLQDHKIGETVVFPFAAYLSMAAEAARQMSGLEDGVSFRNVKVSTALVVDEDGPTEVITSLSRHRLTDNLDSDWWDFNVYSHNGHVWMRHCWGMVKGEASEQPPAQGAELMGALTRKVDVTRWYESASRQGIKYGPTFTAMEDITASTVLPYQAAGKLRNNRWGDVAQYHLHPVLIDTYFQLLSCSNYHGIGHAYRRLVMDHVDEMTIWRCSETDLKMHGTTEPTATGCVGFGAITTDSTTVMKITGCHALRFEEAEVKDEDSVPISARCEWIPHIDFQDANKLISASKDQVSNLTLFDEICDLAVQLASATAAGMDVRSEHLRKYQDWLLQQSASAPGSLDASSLSTAIESLIERLEGPHARKAAKSIQDVCSGMPSLLEGQVTGFELLNADGNLDSLMSLLKEQDDIKYFACLGQSKPNIKILEIGAGLGSKTSSILKSLTRPDGRPLYSRYVFTDASSGMLKAAKEQFKGVPNMEFLALNLDQSFSDQGFGESDFDLIIATSVVSSSSSTLETLKALRGLLSAKGKILLEEPRPGLSWINFTLGTMPQWWSHTDDDRSSGPYIDSSRWKADLASAGFHRIKEIDFSSTPYLNQVFIATAEPPKTVSKRLTLLGHNPSSVPEVVVSELTKRGYEIDQRSLGEALPQDQDVVAFLDEEKPYFENMDATAFAQFKTLIGNLGGSSGLMWITRLSNIGCTDPRYAQVIGLTRSLRGETASDIAVCEINKITSANESALLVDVLNRFQAREKDGVLSPDYEYAIFDGEVYVNRIFPFALEDDLRVLDTFEEACLSINEPGRLNTLAWSSQPTTTPKEDEVEVEIHASGLNFRDVLVAMQIVPGPMGFDGLRFGYEASGIVQRVGSNVTKLRVGDRVVLASANTFSSTFTCSQLLVEKMPDSLSFIDAAAIPIVFMTAVHGLINLAQLSKGQSVLIHSACGGVGLSAIQVARMIGAEIFVTVGSEEKVQYLVDNIGIPRNRIFNSRNATFADELLRETNGNGVDVALNSLSGELLHATWKCVAKFGYMIEIGKRDLLDNAKLDMHHFLSNRNYCCIDMDQMRCERPASFGRVLRQTMDLFEQGLLSPIRIDQTFTAGDVVDAFRYMQQGKHIGKIVLEFRDSNGKFLAQDVDLAKPAKVQLDPLASYLMVGGLGGLGRSMSVWMVQRGARNLIFLSRSAGSGQHDKDFVTEIESMGCKVQLVRGSITNVEDVARAIDGAAAPLKGVVQMSMVLRDQMFDGMSLEDWNAVTRPKVQGTWNLHEVTTSRGLDLDFFLLFSSLSGVVGQVGQANYASANTFLDAFTQYRSNLSLPCTSIELGAMEGVGYLSENTELLTKMQGSGWRAVRELELLDSLDLAMMSPASRKRRGNKRTVATDNGEAFALGLAPTTSLSSADSSARLRSDVRMAIYHNIGNSNTNKSAAGSDSTKAFINSLKKDPSLLQAPETAAQLAVEIGKKLNRLILAGDKEVDITMSTADMGLDSLVSVELRGWWKITFGFEISTIEMLSMGTLEALGKRAADGLANLHAS